MPAKIIAGQNLEVNEEGYLIDHRKWTKEIAAEIAKEEGINDLTEKHWEVIKFIQQDFAESGKVPGIRRINKTGGIPTKDLYELFPDGPVKKAARISGLPKPQSCV